MSALATRHRGELDRLWTEFWTGGITNPLTVIEQISFLVFARLLDEAEARDERQAARTGRPGRRSFGPDQQHLRWSALRRIGEPEALLRVVRDEVFPHLQRLDGATRLAGYLRDARLAIQKPSLLAQAVARIDALPLGDADAKGDLYEHLLSKLSTAGINGQFRTPRHIIRFMVELVEPRPTETVADPACGTAGFLVGTMRYLLERYTSPGGRLEGASGEVIHTGDQLEAHREHIQTAMLHGFDVDATMLRIASMNLLLHGVGDPSVHYQDALSRSCAVEDRFDVILANPPFKGSLDEADVHPALQQAVRTRKTELLFLALILRLLKPGGRGAAIVPDGVLFGASRAHLALRQLLVRANRLDAVISLPPGVFKPYAGVSAAILVFAKGGATDHVFFYDVEAEGFSLDDRRAPLPEDDLPDALARWRRRDPRVDTDRTARHFMVPVEELEANQLDLSINRYRQRRARERDEDEAEQPRAILARLRALEAEISQGLARLEEML